MIQTKERIQNFILFFTELICLIISFYAAGIIWLIGYKHFSYSFAFNELNGNILSVLVSYLLLIVIDTGAENFTSRGYFVELKELIKKYI